MTAQRVDHRSTGTASISDYHAVRYVRIELNERQCYNLDSNKNVILHYC